MDRQHFTTAVRSLVALAPLGLAFQRPKPAPAPVPAPAPAPTLDDAQAQEQAKQERIKHAREAEAERLKQEQEAARVKHARTEAATEAERVKRAREQAADQPREADADRVAAARGDAHETARKMLSIEDVHRERLGRLDRLLAIYGESGDAAKLEEVGKLKMRENKRYLLIIDQFKVKLGPDFARYESQLLAGQQRHATALPSSADKSAEPARAPVPRREAKPAVKDEKSKGGK